MSITILIIVVTGVVSFTCFQRPQLLDELLYWPPGVARGQYWRLITHGFVHADGQHLLFNMITLYFFGRAIEGFFVPYIGAAGFVLFYLGGIVVAMLPSAWAHRNDPTYRSLGASGAVSAILFSYIFMAPWSIIYVFVLPVPAILFAALYVGYSFYANEHGLGNINHSAHLWGAAYGIVFSLLMEPRLWDHFLHSLLAPLG
ncbi:MAG TPA: rhomboid family intramembrane serine protease [Salinisphaeraceae bacterium]|nr:rhomboid family intramembrane serine protease [Salinisphaeraceae bacterium]